MVSVQANSDHLSCSTQGCYPDHDQGGARRRVGLRTLSEESGNGPEALVEGRADNGSLPRERDGSDRA